MTKLRMLSFERMAAVVFFVFYLLVISPIILQKLIRRKPLLFKQERVGKNGTIFIIYKLPTMVAGIPPKDIIGNERRLHEQHRIDGWIGKFCRKTHLDEGMQLLNVAKGDMHIVGPRPLVPNEVFGSKFYGPIHFNVAPGITGPFQISEYHVTHPEMRESIERPYFKSRNFFTDIGIVLQTPFSVMYTNIAPRAQYVH